MPKRGDLSVSPDSDQARMKSIFGSSLPAGGGSDGFTGTTCFAELPSRLRVATASMLLRLAEPNVVIRFRSLWKCAVGPLLAQACSAKTTEVLVDE